MTLLITSIVVFNLIAIFIPKQLTKLEMYATSLLAILLAENLDYLLDLKYDLYGYFKRGVDLVAYLPIFGIYPAINIIFLNFFPFAKSKKSKILYIIGWSVFAVIFEWASIKAGYFYYNQWNLLYSALVYPVLYIILAWNLSIIRKWIKQ